jgi:hypothetical protein
MKNIFKFILVSLLASASTLFVVADKQTWTKSGSLKYLKDTQNVIIDGDVLYVKILTQSGMYNLQPKDLKAMTTLSDAFEIILLPPSD